MVLVLFWQGYVRKKCKLVKSLLMKTVQEKWVLTKIYSICGILDQSGLKLLIRVDLIFATNFHDLVVKNSAWNKYSHLFLLLPAWISGMERVTGNHHLCLFLKVLSVKHFCVSWQPLLIVFQVLLENGPKPLCCSVSFVTEFKRSKMISKMANQLK